MLSLYSESVPTLLYCELVASWLSRSVGWPPPLARSMTGYIHTNVKNNLEREPETDGRTGERMKKEEEGNKTAGQTEEPGDFRRRTESRRQTDGHSYRDV